MTKVKKMAFSNPDYSSHQVFSRYFSSMKDPRRTNKGHHLYPLEEILFLCISAVISGMDDWTSITMFGRLKLPWLRQYLPYRHGIPSHDVLGKVFAALDPIQFSACFRDWVNSMAEFTGGQVVAIDGKTICGSDDKVAGKSALHVVSAYASGNRLCLGQEVVTEKSNEITAIPALLKLLTVKDCIITIDAMGCQKSIAGSIVEKGADYILMVKDNQQELKEQVEKVFAMNPKTEADMTIDAGHGRIEKRTCQAIENLTFLDDKQDWPGLKSIAKVISERTDKRSGHKSSQTRYYISSLPAKPKVIGQAIRSHWAIENNLHWTLDMLFKEDNSLKKKGNSPLNYNIIAKMALNIIERETESKSSKPQKRKRAALDDEFRSKLIAG
ncbi:ISAs1 family transposase [Pedobacter helvus]|uniref:ISAs1 family transposase n=1 Tax=Pedobacter helvus TaxID=2563444 RepID=A0ABW9JLD1_9SPHI|nr:ISAs1 family transposase [Pedobacter ureilyticus]